MNCTATNNASSCNATKLLRDVDFSLSVSVARFLWISIAPVILSIGLVGNSLSLCVFMKKPLNKSSSTFALLACLAISDSLVLLTGLLRDWLSVLRQSEFNAFNRSLMTCTPVEVLSVASMYCSAWILVAVSIDRYLAIRVPIKSRSLRTPLRARQLAVSIALVSIVASLLMTFSNRQRAVCFTQSSSEAAMWLDVCVYSLLPSLLLFAFNSAMLLSLLSRKTQQTRHAATRRLSCVALTVSMSYLLMTLPNALLLIAAEIHKPLLSNPVVIPVQTATMLLWYSNHAVNFLLYCFTASQVRKALCLMVPHWDSQSLVTI